MFAGWKNFSCVSFRSIALGFINRKTVKFPEMFFDVFELSGLEKRFIDFSSDKILQAKIL
jgi:hypothetical protein